MQVISMSSLAYRKQAWTQKLNISNGARILFDLIASESQGKCFAWPKKSWLMEEIGRSERTVQRYQNELVEAGVIAIGTIITKKTARWGIAILPHPALLEWIRETTARFKRSVQVVIKDVAGSFLPSKMAEKTTKMSPLSNYKEGSEVSAFPPTPQRGNAAGAAKEREHEQTQTQKGSAAEDGQFRTTGKLPRDNAALPDAVPGDAGGEQGSFLGPDRLPPSNRSLAGHGTDGVGRVLLRLQPTGNPALSGNVGGGGFSQPERTPDALSYRQAKRRSGWYVSEIGRNLCRKGRSDNNAGQCDGIHFPRISTGTNVLQGVTEGLGDVELSSPEKSERTAGTRRTGDAGYACLPPLSRAKTAKCCNQRGSEASTGSAQEKRPASCSKGKDGKRQDVCVPASTHGRTCGTTCLQRLGHRTLDGIFSANELNCAALTPAPWQAALALLLQQIPERDFNLWIRPINACQTSDGLRLDCPDRYAMAWVQEHFNNAISDALEHAGITDFFFTFGEQAKELQEKKNKELRAEAARNAECQAKVLQSLPMKEQFAVLVSTYPRKTSGNWFAWRAFSRLHRRGELPDIQQLLQLVQEEKSSEDWQRDAGRWIPGLHKWLRNKPWWNFDK